MTAPEQRPIPSVGGPADAESLATAIVEQIAALERIIQDETDLLKASRLRDAAALADDKSDAARRYVHALDALKANAIALARWSPQGVSRLKTAQARLAEALGVNMAVLATARSVSEGIVRSLAADVAAPRTLTTYGAGGKSQSGTRQTATPLMVSRNL